jgi:hypothetical protein
MAISHKSPAAKDVKTLLKQVGIKLNRNDVITRMESGIYSVNDQYWVDVNNWEYGDIDMSSESKDVPENTTKAKINEVVAHEGNLVLRRKVWKDVPDELKVDISRIGNRVWVAGVERTAKLTLDRIHVGGKKPYPVDTVILSDASRRRIPFYLDSVVLHPKNFTPTQVKNFFDPSVVGERVTVSNTGKTADGKVSKKRGRKGKDIEKDVRAWLKKPAVKRMKFKNAEELAKAAAKGQKKYWWMVRPNHQIHELSKVLFDELKNK